MNADRDVLAELVAAAGRRCEPSRDEYERTLAAVTLSWHRSLRRRRSHRVLAFAAALTAAAIGLAVLLHRAPPPSPAIIGTAVIVHGDAAFRTSSRDVWRPLRPGVQIPAGAELRTGPTAGLALNLVNGLSARLDKRSTLAMDSGREFRLISGGLYVDTGGGTASGALRIDTALGTVFDVGTAFETRIENGSVRIRVRDGVVRFDAIGAPSQLQAAGDEFEIDLRGTVRRRHCDPSDDVWSWASALAPLPEVEGQPLLKFLAWVAHETGRRVRFEAPEVERQADQVTLHGTLRDLTPLQALDVMLSTTDLEYVLSKDDTADDLIVIRRRPG
jgi:ferric-dicitrate binding protein FerR (iron transport regulator)